MSFYNVEAAIESCVKHLAASNAKGSEIESFLTRYLLVLICGSFENEIKRLVVERARLTNDEDITSFVSNTMKEYRSLLASDLKGKLMAKFGTRHEDGFDRFLKEKSEVVARYNNIVTNRHSVAHGRDVNMTLDELVVSYHESEKLIRALRKIIGV